MQNMKKYIKSMWLIPPSVLTLFTLIITIIGITTPLRGWLLIGTSLILTVIVSLVVILVANAEDFITPTVKYYPNRSSVPIRYGPMQTLDEITTRKGELTIVGRSCFSWLCGNEFYFNHDMESYEIGRRDLSNKILAALRHGSCLHFVIQNPYEPVLDLNPLKGGESENEEAIKAVKKLSIQIEEAIGNFKEIRRTFLEEINQSNTMLQEGKKKSHQPNDLEKLELSVYPGQIRNGMLHLKLDHRDERFHLDLRTVFEDPKSGLSKPMLVFQRRRLAPRSFDHHFKPFRDDITRIKFMADPIKEYDKKKQEAENDIATIKLENYPLHSITRNNTAEALNAYAANIFVSEFGLPPWKSTKVRPACIQFLVTNRCTTTCKMCNHHALYNPDEELETVEIERILDSIKKLQTRALIISGGEPLARPDILHILRYAKKQCDLKIGLLTNGIRQDPEKNGEVRGINIAEAEGIANSCSWVQLSLDAFTDDIYRDIRKNGSLDYVKATIMSFEKAKFKNVEVCYTIQKDNVKELLNGKENFLAIAEWLTAKEYSVRFKIAHGPDQQGRSFLCNEMELRKVIREGVSLQGLNSRFDFKYLETMINNNIFDYSGLAKGEPVNKRLHDLRRADYTCMALRLTCKITANGDVYPCCFLFDDNFCESKLRERYKMGSLRHSAGTAVDPKAGNELENIWFGEDHKAFQRRPLPVDREACGYCTRHFHQNLYMNALFEVFRKFSSYRLAEEWATKGTPDEPFWV